MGLNNLQQRCVSRITGKPCTYMCIKSSDVMSSNRTQFLFLVAVLFGYYKVKIKNRYSSHTGHPRCIISDLGS